MQQAIRPWGWRVDTFCNWWCIKKLGMNRLCSHIASYTHYEVGDKCPSSGHTQTYCPYTLEAWIITRIYWMVLVVPHSIRSFFIGLVIDETAMMGEDEEQRGLQHSGSKWNRRMSTSTEAGLGCHLVWWTPRSCGGGDEWLSGFLLKAMNKSGRAKVWEPKKDAL